MRENASTKEKKIYIRLESTIHENGVLFYITPPRCQKRADANLALKSADQKNIYAGGQIESCDEIELEVKPQTESDAQLFFVLLCDTGSQCYNTTCV